MATTQVCPTPEPPKDSPPPPQQHLQTPESTTRPHSAGSTGSHRAVRPSVYITRRIPQAGVEALLKECDVRQWDAENSVPRGEFLHSVKGVHAILCMPNDNIDKQVLDAAGPNLQVIATISDEYQHIDKAECCRRGVTVIQCPSQSTDQYAELTVALALLTMRESLTDEERLLSFEPNTPDLITTSGDSITASWLNNRPRYLRRMSEERLAFQWSNGKPCNTKGQAWKQIASKTFGVYGLTEVGHSVARTLKNFGVGHVMMADCDAELDNSGFVNKGEDCGVQVVPFQQLLTESDVICVCGSSGQQSTEVFNRASFKKMSASAILVASQSEEPAIDYVALYEALRDHQIKAAGLNDCNQEPVPFKEPLLGLQNCIFLPQAQESVYDMRHKVSVIMAKNLIVALRVKMDAIAE